MARRPRLALAGELHLLQLRGHNDQPVFIDEADRAAFCDLLREAAARHRVAIHAYALVLHEVLLLATPPESPSLGRLVQSLGRVYVTAFNRRHQRRGTLWDGRFRSCILQADRYLLPATVHLETLPVRTGLVAQAGEWPWSSAPHHSGQRRDPIVTDHPSYWQLGNTPFERERAHTEALAQPVAPEPFEKALRQSAVLGDPAFRARIAAALDRPVDVRPRGRPRRAPGE